MDSEIWFEIEDIAKELLLDSKDLSEEKQNNIRNFLNATRNLILNLPIKMKKSIQQTDQANV